MKQHTLQTYIGRRGRDTRVVLDGVDLSDRLVDLLIHTAPHDTTTITIQYVNLDNQPITLHATIVEVQEMADVSAFGDAPGSRLQPVLSSPPAGPPPPASGPLRAE